LQKNGGQVKSKTQKKQERLPWDYSAYFNRSACRKWGYEFRTCGCDAIDIGDGSAKRRDQRSIG